MPHYDLIVIGAGATGLGAARAGRGGNGKSRRVALVEAELKPGGDCTHFGCVPSKALLETSRRVAGAASGPAYGFHADITVDFPAVMRRVHEVIGEIEQDESPALLARQGIDLVTGRCRFTDPHTLEVFDGPATGTTLSADQFVIASGGDAAIPPVDGIDDVPYLTNRTVFDLTELPAHLLVMGGGPIGSELTQAFRRLGAAVTLVQSPDRLLPKDEPEAGRILRDVLEREGVDVRLGARAVKAAVVPEGIRLDLKGGGSATGTHLLVATGRRAHTDDLGLDAAGVEVDPKSRRVVIDEHLRTTAKHIWSAGDCATPYQFTHVGDEQGRLAAANAFARRPGTFSFDVIPWTTFTEPEIGHVGLTEAEAYQQYGEKAVVAFVPMNATDRARCAGETDGFVKLIAAPRNAVLSSKYLVQVVGMTAVAPCGGELVHEAAVAMRSKMLAARLAQTIHAYPTWSLATRMAAAQFFGTFGGRTARPARPDRG